MPPKIDSITIRHYRLPLETPFHAAWDPQPRASHTSTIVRVRAGEYQGVGSGDAMLGFAGHEYLFVGRNPFEIARHVQILDNLQFHYGRMWPLEVALWDLMGKISGLPLWKLLGGRSNRVRVYASTGERRPIPARVESARRLREQGFPALKIRFPAPNPSADIAVVLRQPGESGTPALCRRLEQHAALFAPGEPGPRGWNRWILQWLERRC